MKLIAHRGNIHGPDINQENRPEHLLFAIQKGFDVEVDIWVLDDEILLGHGSPEYLISEEFIFLISDKAWFHCKNLEALRYFHGSSHKYFWHQSDDFTLVSNGYIWTYPEKMTTDKSIIVCLNKEDIVPQAYGICSDYVADLVVVA